LRAHDVSRHPIATVLAFAQLRSLQIPLSLAAAGSRFGDFSLGNSHD
jgi:hypothetical protein